MLGDNNSSRQHEEITIARDSNSMLLLPVLEAGLLMLTDTETNSDARTTVVK